MTADKKPKPPAKPEPPKASKPTDKATAPAAGESQPATAVDKAASTTAKPQGTTAPDKPAPPAGQTAATTPASPKAESSAAADATTAGASATASGPSANKGSAAVTSTEAPDKLKNHFLMAMPVQGTSYFANTLTLMCEHTEEGAMGLVINRPSKIPLSELLNQLGIKSNNPAAKAPVIEGGPVSPERAFILHSDDKKFAKSQTVAKGLVLTTERDALEAIAAGEGPRSFLVALGYAGWAKGQLEEELKQNVWLTCAANAEIIFTTPFSDRLDKAAAGIGVDLRLMSGQPGHA